MHYVCIILQFVNESKIARNKSWTKYTYQIYKNEINIKIDFQFDSRFKRNKFLGWVSADIHGCSFRCDWIASKGSAIAVETTFRFEFADTRIAMPDRAKSHWRGRAARGLLSFPSLRYTNLTRPVSNTTDRYCTAQPTLIAAYLNWWMARLYAAHWSD